MAVAEPYAGPVKVTLTMYVRRPKRAVPGRVHPVTKPDLDNALKLIDGANGVVWRDDAQVVEISARKVYADGEPGLHVIVQSMS